MVGSRRAGAALLGPGHRRTCFHPGGVILGRPGFCIRTGLGTRIEVLPPPMSRYEDMALQSPQPLKWLNYNLAHNF